MPPQQQMAVMRTLSPAQQQAVQAEIANSRSRSNRNFMRQSIEKIAYCPVSGGSGTTASYSNGTTLVFDLPVVGSGYVKALLITYTLTVTPASGSSAVYAVNAAAPYNIFNELYLNYNGAQIRTHPYFLKVLDQMRGWQRGAQNRVLAGNNDATIAGQVVGTTPVVSGSANTWQGKILLPLNAIGDDTVPGVLPVMGVGNKPQLRLTCSSSMLGYDPLLYPISVASGSGHSVTVTGTVNVDMIYLDGTNMDSPAPLQLGLVGEPTLQYYWDTPLTPLTQGTLQRQHISTLLEHWYAVSILIDGVQSSTFSTIANIAQFQMSPDSVGQQSFVSYNVSNNVSIYDFYDRQRRAFGQDLDPGVIAWVAAPSRGVIDPSNRNGRQALNMRPGGYPATTHAYYVTTATTTNMTPRVETFLVSMNYDGLKIQQG